MNRINVWLRNLARTIMTRMVVPIVRPVVWHVVYFDLIRQPAILRYIKARMAVLDRYEELFPGARECGTRKDVHDLAVAVARKSGMKGLWLEFGVWNGLSINHIARQVQETVYGFDSFEGLPVVWWEGKNAVALVTKEYFKRYSLPKVRRNVKLVKGWFDKTLPGFLAEHGEPVAFIHIDSDVYESAKVVFDLLGDRIVKGTVILFDELFNYPCWEDHEWRAFQEFIKARNAKVQYLAFNSTGEQVAVQVV